MRVGLISAALFSGCLTAPITVSRTMMVPLPPVMAQQVVPDDFATLWAGVQSSPFELESSPTTANQLPAAQPEIGTLFLIKDHLLIGGSLHCASSSWAKKANPDQIPLNDGAMMGVRLRVGVTFELTQGFGLTSTLEPGLDLLPWTISGARDDFLHDDVSLGGSLTPFWRWGRLTLFGGAYAASLPVTTRTVTVPGNCPECADPGSKMTAMAAVLTGVRVNTGDVTLAFAVTVPITRNEVAFSPLFSLSVAPQLHRAPEPERVEPPPDEDEAPQLYVPPHRPSQL